MPGWFILGLILMVVAIICTLMAAIIRDDTRIAWFGAAAVAICLSLLCIMISSFNIVSTRNVGIVTQFGRPVGEKGNGVAWVAPWQSVHEMDGAIQLQSFVGEAYKDPKTAIQVRLGNNSSAFVNANLNWRIRPGSAPQMFQDFRTFDNIRENLVDKQLQVALSREFATFNPQEQTQALNLPDIASRVKHDLQNAVGADIEILDVRVPGIFYNDKTQELIDHFNEESQNTHNAEQAVKTAQQRKTANDIIAQSVSNDPLVVVAQCINESLAKNQPTAGCWPIGGQPLISVGASPQR